jgi:ribosomal protein S18 acetylase RimI-like enzyme
MDVKILRASQDDLETILQLQKDCYKSEAEIYNDYSIPPLQQDMQSMEKEFETSVILKGVVQGQIVGSVRGYADQSTSYIGRLIVAKEFQNRGYGRMLMNAIESEFRECQRFELFTGKKSIKNLYLYQKLGYKEFKEQVIHENLTMVYLEKFQK